MFCIRQTAEFFVCGCQMGHILIYPKDFYEIISNVIHFSSVVELTYLIAGNGNFLKIAGYSKIV
jgi:hypothetical protein